MSQSTIRIQAETSEDPYTFEVEVVESGSSSTHRVSMSESVYRELTDGKLEPEECVRWAFEFLLEREPKESILGQFDILVIERYFPEFRRKLKERVAREA